MVWFNSLLLDLILIFIYIDMHYSSNTANLDVDRQRNRVLATRAMKESLQMAEQGKTIISSI